MDVPKLLSPFWENPDDTSALMVWADALVESGDLRGEWLQLNLVEARSAEQEKKLIAYGRKHGGKLVGPARPYLREWAFGPTGLVERARCEADKLVAGIAEIALLNPRLSLTITSLGKKSVVAALAKVALAPIYFVDFTGVVMGTHGAAPVSEATLLALIPALSGVRNLTLSCRGYGDGCFTPLALEKLGDALERIEFLAIDYYRAGENAYEDTSRARVAPREAYVEAIARGKGFQSLRAIVFEGADLSPLASKLPNLVTTKTSDYFKVCPNNAEKLARLTKPA